jgi:AAHS family 4-hydroxybenzoate transporter-like MFS transporter
MDRGRAARILSRVAPELRISQSTRLLAGNQGIRQVQLRQLLQDGRALGTALVWIGMFMNLMIYFFLQKWLTSLLVMVGLAQAAAIQATALSLAAGIVAAFIIGPLMDRIGPYGVVAGLFAGSALACVVMGQVLTMPQALLVLAGSLLIGFCLSGGQKANNALSFYPTALRGTGLGWGLGVAASGACSGHGCRASAEQRMEPTDLFCAAAVPVVLGGRRYEQWANFTARRKRHSACAIAMRDSLQVSSAISAPRSTFRAVAAGRRVGHDRTRYRDHEGLAGAIAAISRS